MQNNSADYILNFLKPEKYMLNLIGQIELKLNFGTCCSESNWTLREH